MGVFSGPITFRRFLAVGELPENFRELYLENIAKYVHQEIDPSSDAERSIGWVAAGDLLDLDFDLNKVLVGDYLVLQLRVDTLKVPAGPLKIYLARAEKEYREATGRERLSKSDKEEIKDRVIKALRKRVLPAMKGFDMAWNIQTGVVRLWTHDKTVADEFQELFVDTFGMRLVPRTTFTALSELGFDDDALESALRLDPSDLVLASERGARAAA